MTLELYAHPFSSYCQKVLIALYENATPFELKMLAQETPEHYAALSRLWPLRKFPLLVENAQPIVESSVIIEYLGLHHPGPVVLVPADSKGALEVRFMDRFFDNYVMTPMQRIVGDFLRAREKRDPQTILDAHIGLDTAYAWLDERMANRSWASGNDFTLADCAAAPALFFADWVRPIADTQVHLRAYRDRLLARPSIVRVVNEARPFRHFFPPGAPARD
jgi:glutathione S-transferase